MSQFEFIEQQPPDPILGVTEAFKKDTSPNKLNLGVGAYRTEEIKPYILPVVQKAEQQLIAKQTNKEYLPIDGLPDFKVATTKLLFGDNSKALQEGRVVTLQSLSGTGSLRVGGQFISKFFPNSTIYISNPTWGNHKNVFNDSGLQFKNYRYYDQKTIGLDFDGMMEDLSQAPPGSFVLLHGCAHNPTGIDPTKEQWGKIADLCLEKKLIPFLDVAYQGFASGSLEEDAYSTRLFADRNIEMLVAQSYAKNLGLYGERVGALNFVSNSKETSARVLSQLKRVARALYSSPPLHGAAIVVEVVNNPQFFDEWKSEMQKMAGRIIGVRQKLQKALELRDPNTSWSFVTKQIGMFSFTGLNPIQVDNMTSKHHVYMTKDGRVSLAGLPSSKVDYLADAIIDSFKIQSK